MKIIEITKIKEAFDNPYPIKWLSLRPDSSSSAKAKLDDGSELEIHFADDDAGYYDIEFLRSGSMKVSGEGDEFRVFATVQAAILEWWEQADKKYVRAISFSADKGDNNRSKLYKRFAEMWAKKIKWQFKSDDGRRDVEFSLIRPKAVEENFADGKKKVQEAFDNPYPITWEYLNPTGASSGIVKLDDGSALDIHFSEEPAGVYEIEFARDGSNKQMGRSGQGDEFRVFATVQAAMLKWWEQLDKTTARKITFYANKQDGNRARLYKRFLKMWGDESGWEIEVNAKSGLAAYSLTNPNPDKNDKKTFMQRLFGEEQTVENFADGKKKGKSRPGRVKKSGASCNGSVTALRKRAKNASGEKAKMYHWCANMKSGRKKK